MVLWTDTATERTGAVNLRIARKIVMRLGTPDGDRYSNKQKDMAIVVLNRHLTHRFNRIAVEVFGRLPSTVKAELLQAMGMHGEAFRVLVEGDACTPSK